MDKLPFLDPLLENEDISQAFKEIIEKLIYLGITLEEAQKEVEKIYIMRTLESFSNNRSKTARKLGMHRNTLNKKIEEYKLNGGSDI